MKKPFLSANAALRVLLAAGCLSLSLQAQDLEQIYRRLNLRFTPPTSGVQAKSLLESGNPKIDPELRHLVLDSRTKSLRALSSSARDLAIPMDGDRIAVVATAESESDVDALTSRIRREGGTVVAIVDDAVLARVPADSIDPIGSDAALAYMGPQSMLSVPPNPYVRAAARSIGIEGGVALTKANLLHQKGIRGEGVKVGVLDFGFTGYQALQAQGLLPAPKAVKAFGKDQGWDRVSTGTVHGAACAEIIHAMAPQADLYIAAVGDGEHGASDDEIIQAAMWLAEQHVDIVSFSGGGIYGPRNGTALLDKLVEEIVGKGILWVNAAGNEGVDHWATNTQLNDQNLVMVGDKPYLLIQATGPAVGVLVSWDDWGPNPLKPSSTQDFDVFLAAVDPATNDVTVVAASQNPQNGSSPPVERVAAASQPGQVFAVFIQAKKVDRALRMHVFGLTPEKLVPTTADGSITIPATSSKALSVAAINANNVALEPFSSRGPTDDGRAKPDIAAPDAVVSKAYKGEFYGTSAACPHAAGFAALIRQTRGAMPPAELAQIVSAATSPIANNRGAGKGMIDGSKVAAGERISGEPGGGLDRLNAVLQLAREDNELGVKVVVGRPEYQIGDGLKIGYRANRDSYCLLIHRSSEGEYTPLLPREGGELRLRAGERYAFPQDSGTTITITGPPGTDEVGLVCSSARIGIESIEKTDRNSLSVSVVHYKVVE